MMPTDQQQSSRGIAPLVVAALFAVLGGALLYWFVTFAQPPERQPRIPFRADYSDTNLVAALAPGTVRQQAEQIAALGSRPGERGEGRFTGSPGFYRTEALIAATFRAAGLEVSTQEFPVVVPVTEQCELVDAQGRPLDGVVVYPFAPHALLPVALPPDGVRARLVATESAALKHLAGHQPATTIVVTYLDAADEWGSLASAGVRALLVREDELAKKLQADPDQPGAWRRLLPGTEATFPRFVVRGPIDRYFGQEVTLRCRVVWQTKRVRNVLGMLRSGTPRREALVLNAFYDNAGLVPELAPGAEQSLSVAALLAWARALAPYRDRLQRDILFVATAGHAQGLAGATRLLEAIEPFSARQPGSESLAERRRANRQRLEDCRHAEDVVAQLVNGQLTRERWLQEVPAFRTWFERGYLTVAGEVNLDRREEVLDAKLRYLRAGSPVYREGFDAATATDAARKDPANSHPLLVQYLQAQQADNRSANMMSMSLWQAAAQREFQTWGYSERLRSRLSALTQYHTEQLRELDDLEAVARLFAPYQRTLTLNVELFSGGDKRKKDLAVLVGIPMVGNVVEPQVSDLSNTIQEKVPRQGEDPDWKVINWGPVDAGGSQERPNSISPNLTELESEPWFMCGRLAFTVASYQFYPPKAGTPEDTLASLAWDTVENQTLALGRAWLAVGFGRVPFPDARVQNQASALSQLQGTVYTSAGSSSLVPTHPMGERTYVQVCDEAQRRLVPSDSRNVQLYPVMATNPDGAYERRLACDVGMSSAASANAARFDAQGRLLYFKDASEAGSAVYRSEKVPHSDLAMGGSQAPKLMHVPTFRCSVTALYDQGNPKTLKSFQGVTYLSKQGLSAPARFYKDSLLTFLEPTFEFYLGFLDGAAGNPEIQQYRAFLLNADPHAPLAPTEPDLFGRGYLAADTPVLTMPHLDGAASMLRTAQKRLQLQERYKMADEQMLAFQQHGREWYAEACAQRDAAQPAAAVNAAGTSLAYAINNHPVIRERIAQAVVGILWYLGLLVPFVFFAEKLLFGFTDIRQQLLANAIIFVVFLLLRLFHPAFQMVASSLVILLGFIILLLTLLVTMMVGAKFKQNIKELRSREGRVEGADINRAGVVGTAFMLGLNNMRRRKVRTGLTCSTLVLITFVMICFTSVSSNLINIEYATGKSGWNGIMLRNENFRPLEEAELANLRRLYGERLPVTAWQWLTPFLNSWLAEKIKNPEIVVDRESVIGDIKTVKRARLNGAIRMEWNEPQFTGIDRLLLTKRGWFPRPPTTRQERLTALASGYKDRRYVILPDTAARELGLTPAEVDTGHPQVNIRGQDYEVLGIIDSVELGKVQGLDGQSILPYDLNRVQSFGQRGIELIVPNDVTRLNGSQVMIVNIMPPGSGNEMALNVSCAILFPRAPYRLTTDAPELPPIEYREQRRLVLEYLERVGMPAYYAIDGVAYYGSRQRARTIAGLLELLVPVVLAALTVFNTMRGSVYERKDEIYVYNAVGIAPNHVFFIFMAEALVYAVVGAMLGYLLSQATGRALTALHLTGGLNMDYSSIETIYASLAIMAATLLSTILPARDAARMASPSDTVSWAMPRAVGDEMILNLPFTFTAHDRIAVVSYFHRWLDANGAGSTGPFFCGPPEETVRQEAGGPGGQEPVPVVSSTIWLKPYDLGVSQRIEISLPTDTETGEYIARIRLVRLSGHVAAWERTVKPFLGVVRKQFLNWRVITTAQREELFTEAKQMLTAAGAKGNPTT